jgi:hypothetical protein
LKYTHSGDFAIGGLTSLNSVISETGDFSALQLIISYNIELTRIDYYDKTVNNLKFKSWVLIKLAMVSYKDDGRFGRPHHRPTKNGRGRYRPGR